MFKITLEKGIEYSARKEESMREFTISSKEANQRLDKFLLKYLNEAPKSFIYKMLRKKNIVLNGKKADGSEKLKENDSVKLFLSEDTIHSFQSKKALQTTNINWEKVSWFPEVEVVYQDEDIIILNKPVGVLSQKSSPKDVSMNEYIIQYALAHNLISEEELQTFKPAICNRLDRNTSGLVVGGLSLAGLQETASLLKEHTLEKYYLTIVKGKLEGTKLLEGYLEKDEQKNKVVVSKEPGKTGKYLKTSYEVLLATEEFSLLKIRLYTGKTHQIRAHLASISHPVIGDYKYGDTKLNDELKKRFQLKAQLLHSYQLRIPEQSKVLKQLSGKTFTAKKTELFQRIEKELFHLT